MTQSQISTPRLELRLMTEEFLNQCLDGTLAADNVGFTIAVEWLNETKFINTCLKRHQQEAGYRAWGVRAIVKRDTQEMLGHIGFHSTPNAEYLRPYAVDAIEFGFTVYPAFRSQGFATEACQGLIGWATQIQGQRRFIVSISPDNRPSLAVVSKLGFVRIGQWEDPEDGTELVFLLEGEEFTTLNDE